MKKHLLTIVTNLGILLAACSTNQPVDGTSIDDMAVALHQGTHANLALQAATEGHPNDTSISKALVPGIKIRTASRSVMQRRFDIAVNNIPARTFYMGLVTETPLSIVVSPEIKGNITLKLKQVTVEQVLQTLENVYGYAYNPIPGGYEILPNVLKTQIYSVNYLELQRKSNSNMILSSGEVTQSSTGGNAQGGGNAAPSPSTNGQNVNNIANIIGSVESKNNVDFWVRLKETLENVIGKEEGRSVTVNPVAGVVVVRAMPKELKQVETYLDIVQNNMDRQVILEAKILEVNLFNQYQMGIDWKLFGATLTGYNEFPNIDIRRSEFTDAFKVNVNWNPESFTTSIHALEEQGNVQVLSSPRVSTMNNQMSAIKVGNNSFFVTNVTSTNNVSNNTSATANPTQSVSLTPFFSGITLDVTPQIDIHGNVTLHIHPSVSLVKDQRKVIDLGTQGGVLNLPLAYSTIRESDTIVHAKNGQVVVIGGLMQNATEESIAEVPAFGNIPFLGTLLRTTKQTARKSELVILIRPIVLNQKTNTHELIDATQRVSRLKRGFHIGSRPDIFGTEGEKPVDFGPKAGLLGYTAK